MSFSASPLKLSAAITGITLTLLLLLVWMLSGKLLTWWLSHQVSIGTLVFVTRITLWLCVAAICWYAIRKENQPVLLWTEQPHSLQFYIISVFATLFVIYAGTVVVATLVSIYQPINKTSIKVIQLRQLNLPLKIFGIFTAAVAEELIMRGYLLPRFQLFFKSKHLPVLITAFIFGLCHFGYGTVINMVIPAWIGVVFGYHYERYRNIKILMIAHFIIDANALLLAK